jgi:hypothetical protein
MWKCLGIDWTSNSMENECNFGTRMTPARFFVGHIQTWVSIGKKFERFSKGKWLRLDHTGN